MKKKIIIGGIIAAIVVVLVAVSVARQSGTAAAFGSGPVFNVKVQKVEKGNLSSYISASGVIEEIDKSEVYFDATQTAPLKVKKLLVKENDKVTKGQKLVELDMDSLNSQLEQLKINKNVQEFARTTASSQSDIVRAQNTVKTAQQAYDDSKKNYENSKTMYDAGAISKNDLDTAAKAMNEAAIALENAKVAYQAAISARNANVGTQDENLKAMLLKIQDLESSISKINETAASPIDGVVTQVNAVDGGMLNNAQPAFVIVNTDKLQAKVNVSEFNIKSVAVGQEAVITGDAIDKSETIKGKVAGIASVATKNRTNSGEETVVEVTIQIDTQSKALKPGLNISCDIYTQDKKGVVVVPMEALKEDKDGNKSVFVVDEKNNTVHEKKVKTGIASDMNIEVLDGINENDLVVLDPQPTLKDGSKVKTNKTVKK